MLGNRPLQILICSLGLGRASYFTKFGKLVRECRLCANDRPRRVPLDAVPSFVLAAGVVTDDDVVVPIDCRDFSDRAGEQGRHYGMNGLILTGFVKPRACTTAVPVARKTWGSPLGC